MILQSSISKLSNRLFREQGGRRIPESVLERDYCIAWFLVGLSHAPLRDKIVFKGGTALRRCHFSDYRFSEDLDFTLLQPLTFKNLIVDLEEVYFIVKKESNITFRFSRIDSASHQNCYSFYLSYEGPLQSTNKLKEIKVDITINEKLFFQPEILAVLNNCEEFYDLPGNARINVYPLLEIASEKTVALLDKARTEPRDLYDLWYLTENNNTVSLVDCFAAIELKLSHRGKVLNDVKDQFQNKESRLRTMWEKRLSLQMANLTTFDHVYRAVKRHLRQAGIT
jgi:predicted nucleotidyltransferase component of viral defense system